MLNSLHEALHQALAAGDFASARRLGRELGQAIKREASAAAPADRAALVSQGLSRMQEHLSLARVLRAHIATQLQANAAACLYQPTSTTASRWRFEG